MDCLGDCNGDAIFDECGVCDGNCFGTSLGELAPCQDSNGDYTIGCDGLCDPDIHIDCLGICNGNAAVDDCGVCGGSSYFVIEGTDTPCNQGEPNCVNQASGACDCGSATWDCNDDCGGSAYIDNCGNCVSGSTGLDPCEADCSEFDYQCDGVWANNACWGGSAVTDMCGICTAPPGQEPLDGQFGYCDGTPGGDYCQYECGCYNIEGSNCDCNENIFDDCGVCGGDGSTCILCNIVDAINYDPNALVDSECLLPYDGLPACHSEVIDAGISSNYICDILPGRCTDGEFTSGEKGIWNWNIDTYDDVIGDIQGYCSSNPEQCTQEAYSEFLLNNHDTFYPMLISEGDCELAGWEIFMPTSNNFQSGGLFL